MPTNNRTFSIIQLSVLLLTSCLVAVESPDFGEESTRLDVLTYIYGSDDGQSLERAMVCMDVLAGHPHLDRFTFNHVERLCRGLTPVEKYAVYTQFDSIGHRLTALRETMTWELPQSPEAQLLWFQLAIRSDDKVLRGEIFRLMDKFCFRGVLSEEVKAESVAVYDQVSHPLYYLRFSNARYSDAFREYMDRIRPYLKGRDLDKVDTSNLKHLFWVLARDAIMNERDDVLAFTDERLDSEELVGMESLAYTLVRYRLDAAGEEDHQRLESELARLKEGLHPNRRDGFDAKIRSYLTAWEVGLGSPTGRLRYYP